MTSKVLATASHLWGINFEVHSYNDVEGRCTTMKRAFRIQNCRIERSLRISCLLCNGRDIVICTSIKIRRPRIRVPHDSCGFQAGSSKNAMITSRIRGGLSKVRRSTQRSG